MSKYIAKCPIGRQKCFWKNQFTKGIAKNCCHFWREKNFNVHLKALLMWSIHTVYHWCVSQNNPQPSCRRAETIFPNSDWPQVFTWHLPLDCETLAQPCLFLQDDKVSIEPDAVTGQKWQHFGEISVFYFLIELNAQHIHIWEQEQKQFSTATGKPCLQQHVEK